MAYFKHLPDILYQSPLSHKNSSGDYINIKNIFRRTKLKDYLAGNVSLFNKYVIEDGERPDTIAENLYGSSQYDFVVVLVAGITKYSLGDWDKKYKWTHLDILYWISIIGASVVTIYLSSLL